MKEERKTYLIQGRRYNKDNDNEFKEYSRISDRVYAEKRARSMFLKHRGNIETRVVEVDNNTKQRSVVRIYKREDDG